MLVSPISKAKVTRHLNKVYYYYYYYNYYYY